MEAARWRPSFGEKYELCGAEILKANNKCYPEICHFIGGVWRRGTEGRAVINPFDERIIGRIPQAGLGELVDVVSAAESGYRIWRATAPAARYKIMLEAVRLIRLRIEEFAVAMTLDQGKPIAQARLEVLRGCEIIEWDAAEGLRTYGRIIPSSGGMRHTVLRQPIGIVAAFSPWNFPMSSPARKIGAALAAGCALILKPPEETPAAAVLMARAFADAGLPAGVLNLVFGEPAEISAYLIADPAVRLITFTGSTSVGKQLAALAGKHMKPVVMELGGHAPVIVCQDTDPVWAGALSVEGKMRNAGQVCVAPTRFLVHESIADAFTNAFVTKAQAIKIGDGLDSANQMGPLANSRRLESMQVLVDDAVARGARLLCGGHRIGDSGYLFALTVLADVPPEARISSEEPFGPIAIINRFAHLDDAIRMANALPYGLAGYAFTESAATAHRLAEELEVGNLSINHFTASVAETPFGGVKDSGYGREGGVEGVACYMVTKNVSHLTQRPV